MKNPLGVPSAVTVAVLAGLLLPSLLAWDQENPDDPAAHAAAKEALQALGPQRGGLVLNAQIAALVGLNLGFQAKGLDLIGQVEAIEKAIEELGATVTKAEIKIELSADVLFDFDQSDLGSKAEVELGKVATVLKGHLHATVLIEGHTDGKGADDYNISLSRNRAESVKRWLIKKSGPNIKQFTAKGWGKSKPVAPNSKPDGNDNPLGRQKNRRVEITVRKSAE